MTEHWGDIPLGKETVYADRYDASLLAPIPRRLAREALGEMPPFHGEDIWVAYELTWLDTRAKPVAVMAEFSIPCDSPALVESKSLKLYLNSFAGTAFDDEAAVREKLIADLSQVTGAQVGVVLFPLATAPIPSVPPGVCLDALPVACDDIQRQTAELLMLADGADKDNEEEDVQVYSHLVRSLCPVTGQPDWATVLVRYSGPRISPESLLRYLVSFRFHQGFHEQVVEMVFSDIMRRCQPRRLSVQGLFTRRGGIDINPFRSTEAGATPRRRIVRQ